MTNKRKNCTLNIKKCFDRYPTKITLNLNNLNSLTETLRATQELPMQYRLKWMSVMFTVRRMERKVPGSSMSFLQQRKRPILKACYFHLDKLLADQKVDEKNVDEILYTIYRIVLELNCL